MLKDCSATAVERSFDHILTFNIIWSFAELSSINVLPNNEVESLDPDQ